MDSTSSRPRRLLYANLVIVLPVLSADSFQSGEAIGYVGRILSSNEAPHFTMGPYLMQNMLTLLAPALFAASIYMCLGRVILATDGHAFSLIQAPRLTALFVSGDVMGLAIQGAGEMMQTC